MNQLNAAERENIKISGKILSDALKKVTEAVKPGVTAEFLDSIAENEIVSYGAIPAFKDYEVEGVGIYPSTLCVSVNDEVVHGLPTKNKILKNGDIVSLDIGAGYKGIYTDMAITLPVGEVSDEAMRLINVTQESLYVGIKEAIAGNHIGAIGHAIQTYAESQGFTVVRDLVGHGIGKSPHTDPQIPNYGPVDNGPIIIENEALAIEPMINAGTYKIKTNPDGWTLQTADGQLSAHFEHTVLIEQGKPVIVTQIS